MKFIRGLQCKWKINFLECAVYWSGSLPFDDKAFNIDLIGLSNRNTTLNVDMYVYMYANIQLNVNSSPVLLITKEYLSFE